MQEIENCPDCYMNAHTKKDTWFVAACRIPHLLVWAKLKGFPFWPGKAMRINSDENVDVRFFGAHDRAWIPIKDVFLYSEEPPVVVKVHPFSSEFAPTLIYEYNDNKSNISSIK